MRNGFGWWRLAKQVVLGVTEAVASFANSTLTAASATGTADGSTANTLTLTLRDTNNALMPLKAVTFTTELTAVDAGETTLVDDAAEIATTTGTLNLVLTVKNADGTPLPNIAAARIVYASTGTGNTFGTPSVTNHSGQSLCTFTSTVAEAKTISVTVDGVAITQTAAVTVTGTPGLPTLDFKSDWSTATGTSDAAVRDTGQAVPWGSEGGSSHEVMANPGTLGFPGTMTNIYANRMVTTQDAWGEPRITTLDVIADGETRYYRLYRHLSSDTDVIPPFVSGGDDETHGVQDGSAASQINSGWWFYHNTGASGTFTVQWRPSSSANAYPNDRWQLDTTLDKDTTYRFEWSIARNGTTTFKAALRIYSDAGVLLYTGADFRNQTGATDLDTYMASNNFTFFNVDHMAQLQCGLNGLAGIGTWGTGLPTTAPFEYYSYQGGMATGIDTGWIGAYDATNG